MKCELGQEVKTKRPFTVELPTIGVISIPEGTKARITGISQHAAGVITRLWISFPVKPVVIKELGSSKLELEVMPEDVNSTLYHRMKAKILH